MVTDSVSLLKRGLVDIIRASELDQALAGEKKLRIYFGIDPTGPNIHLGHMVVLRKLKYLQSLGHKIVFLIGDFTAMIGDPTDREAMRQPLSREEVLANTKDYIIQASKVIPIDDSSNPVEIRFNSQWHSKKTLGSLLSDLSLLTVQQMMERDMFQERIKNNRPIALSELIYPYLQGFDAVILEADAQIGGTDQTFNMLMGRTLRQKLANEVQLVMTVPLIEGTDGRKMSKSYNNTINLIDTPNDIFGKIMSAKDEIIVTYFTLLTDVSNSELDQIKKDVQAHPKEQKINLAKNIISQIYGLEEANLAEEHFHKVFVKKEIPDDIPTKKISQFKGQNISDVLVKLGLVSSKSEAVRLIDQGGVTFRSKKVETGEYLINETGIIQVGKRKFINLIKG